MILMHALAEGGMRTWTLGEWTAFVGLMTTFVGVTVTPAVLTVLSKIKELRGKTEQAQSSAAQAQTTANDAKALGIRNVDRILDVAKNTPAPSQPILTPLLGVPPEAIQRAFAEQASPEDDKRPSD